MCIRYYDGGSYHNAANQLPFSPSVCRVWHLKQLKSFVLNSGLATLPSLILSYIFLNQYHHSQIGGLHFVNFLFFFQKKAKKRGFLLGSEREVFESAERKKKKKYWKNGGKAEVFFVDFLIYFILDVCAREAQIHLSAFYEIFFFSFFLFCVGSSERTMPPSTMCLPFPRLVTWQQECCTPFITIPCGPVSALNGVRSEARTFILYDQTPKGLGFVLQLQANPG